MLRLRRSETVWAVKEIDGEAKGDVVGGKELGLDKGFLLGFLGALGLYGSLCWVSHEALTLIEDMADRVASI